MQSEKEVYMDHRYMFQLHAVPFQRTAVPTVIGGSTITSIRSLGIEDIILEINNIPGVLSALIDMGSKKLVVTMKATHADSACSKICTVLAEYGDKAYATV